MIPELIALIKTIIKIVNALSTVEKGTFIKLLSKTAKSLGVKLLGETGLNDIPKIVNATNKLINANKTKYLDGFTKQMGKLLPKEVKTINGLFKSKDTRDKLIHQNAEIVYVVSSWIDWIAWKPLSPNNIYGTLWIRVKHASFANPSGIYQFPKHGHPHGYGPYVRKDVYLWMCLTIGAGTVFWATFYRSWYYTHRGIGYGLTYRKLKGDTGRRYYIGKTKKRYYVPR